MELTEQMLSEAEALANMAESESQSLGEGMSKAGGGDDSSAGSPRERMGGTGQQRGMAGGRAQGGNTGKSKTPTGTKAQKAKTKTAGGDIIARQLIENPNPEIGESVMPSESIGEAVDGGSGVAVGEEQVPSHLKEAHKHYFGTLKKEITKRAGTSAATSSGGTTEKSGAGQAAPVPAAGGSPK